MNRKNVIVIGAGIVGVATAIWLQRDGHKVLLIDKIGPAGGASYGNAGIIVPSGVIPINAPGLIEKSPQMALDSSSPLFLRWSYFPKLSPWLLRYLIRANRKDTKRAAVALHALLEDSVHVHNTLCENTPAEKWFKRSDYLFLYGSRSDFHNDAFAWSTRSELGIHWDELTAEQMAEYDPKFGNIGMHAIRLRDHARITNPEQYVKDLAAHFQQEGGGYKQTEANAIMHNQHGVTGVQTESEVLPCDCAVIACGVWSKKLAEVAGVNIPLESERGYHIDFINPSASPRTGIMIASKKFVVTPMDNRIRCAGLVEFAGLDAPENPAAFNLLKKYFSTTWPEVKYEATHEWMGHRPAPADSIPFIGGFEQIPNLFAAFGHHHIGLTSGPKTGRIIADMVANKDAELNLKPYRLSRFTGQL